MAGRLAVTRTRSPVEAEDRRGAEGLPGVKRGGRIAGLVGRVGEVLGLERVARALPVRTAADAAGQRAGQEVPAVELDARLVRPDGHLPYARGIPRVSGEVQPVRAGGRRRLLVENPVEVVALGDRQ